MIERPERFNALLERFLAEEPAAAPGETHAIPGEPAASGDAVSG
jgi:hypothetical protein